MIAVFALLWMTLAHAQDVAAQGGESGYSQSE